MRRVSFADGMLQGCLRLQAKFDIANRPKWDMDDGWESMETFIKGPEVLLQMVRDAQWA